MQQIDGERHGQELGRSAQILSLSKGYEFAIPLASRLDGMDKYVAFVNFEHNLTRDISQKTVIFFMTNSDGDTAKGDFVTPESGNGMTFSVESLREYADRTHYGSFTGRVNHAAEATLKATGLSTTPPREPDPHVLVLEELRYSVDKPRRLRRGSDRETIEVILLPNLERLRAVIEGVKLYGANFPDSIPDLGIFLHGIRNYTENDYLQDVATARNRNQITLL